MNEMDYLVERAEFSICIAQDTFTVCASGERFFTLSVRSALPLKGKADIDDPLLLTREIEKSGETVTAVWTTRSNLWEKKEYRLTVTSASFRYTIHVWGTGRPQEVRYFSGVAEGKRPGGVYDTAGYLLPQPGSGVQNRYFSMLEEGQISPQLMVPPPYCYPFWMEECPTWFGLGLTASPGTYNFDTFAFQNERGRMGLSVNLYSRTEVTGDWEAPGILGCAGQDEWEVLRRYRAWHEENGCTRSAQHENWWDGPYFCGWGEQAAYSKNYGGNIYAAACQEVYADMAEHLDKLGLAPSALIIDDKWQKTYGEALPDPEKWPDLRGFVDAQHKKGRRVVLWFKSWNSEGLPADECVTLRSQPIGADPTNPRYIARMEKTIHTLFSDEAGCYNCDGFKIDFADCMPQGEEIRTYEPGICGVELLKRLIALLHRSAKAVKPDALINCSGCHPYFGDVLDQVRLHDYDYRLRSVKKCMTFRKQIYDAILPGISVDTDFPSFAGHKDMMTYLRVAPTLGVPDLYRLSDIEDSALAPEDWDEVREIWSTYTAKIKGKQE